MIVKPFKVASLVTLRNGIVGIVIPNFHDYPNDQQITLFTGDTYYVVYADDVATVVPPSKDLRGG